jgi:hypothetical protein
MRMNIALTALGLTLALGGAAIARPLDRSARHEKEQLQTYHQHKRIYRPKTVSPKRTKARRDRSVPASISVGKPI